MTLVERDETTPNRMPEPTFLRRRLGILQAELSELRAEGIVLIRRRISERDSRALDELSSLIGANFAHANQVEQQLKRTILGCIAEAGQIPEQAGQLRLI